MDNQQNIIIGKRLKELRIFNDMEQQYVAHIMGYKSDTTISKWENGKNLPNGGKLAKLAQLFNTTTDYILYGENIKQNNTTLTSDVQAIVDVSVQLETPRQHNVLTYAKTQLDEQNSVIKEDETLYISDYRQKVAVTEAVAAGRGFAYGDNEINYCYTDRSDLPRFDIASYITGDSMEPEYHDGDVVLIRKEMYSSPGVYVVDYDGKSYLKKVYQEKDRFRLVSFNEKYDDIIIDLPIADDVYLNIVGRVVGSFVPVSK